MDHFNDIDKFGKKAVKRESDGDRKLLGLARLNIE